MALRAIDLFAGAGGFSEGAAQAGVDVVWAANHWPVAVGFHQAHHPNVRHECQDLTQADFTRVPEHDVLLASPACQGHSRARGKDRPHHDVTRSTAWAVVAAIEARRPRALVVENVPEFLKWKLFPIWRQALEAYDYRVTVQVLDAADVGVPQNRQRVFVVGHLGDPIAVKPGRARHVPASSIVDLDVGRWTPIRRPGRADRTLAVARDGEERFGDEAFLAPYYGQTRTARAIGRPIGTIRTRDAWAVMRAGQMRMLGVEEYRRAMGFPDGWDFAGLSKAKAIHLLGNAVPPALARHVVGSVAAQLGA